MMKLTNLKIGTQLRLGFGLIVLLVAVLGFAAWEQGKLLWEETEGLYQHPLKVRRAIGSLQRCILLMQRDMRELAAASNKDWQESILRDIEEKEVAAQSQISVLRTQYLGPQSDVNDIAREFSYYRTDREETLRLIRAGKMQEAEKRTGPFGADSTRVTNLLSHIEEVSAFALNRGDAFWRDAQVHRKNLVRQLGILIFSILLISILVGYLLLKGIRSPIKELAAAAEQYRQGRFEIRCSHVSSNELGQVAASFNSLAETISAELSARSQAAVITELMSKKEDLPSFALELLKSLIQTTGSQMGAVYLLDKAKTEFVQYTSIGLSNHVRRSFSALALEGEFGTALATGRIQIIADIPEDTRFQFAAVIGDFKPGAMMTIPIINGNETIALISLANLRNYSRMEQRIVADILSVMTARFISVIAQKHLREFSTALENQNIELQAQSNELSAQGRELAQQNAELEMQKKQLEEATQLKSNFLSNMSHELRTPLNSVIALTGVLQRRLKQTISEEELDYLEVVARNARHLLSLINDILDLSRIEAGKEEIQLSHFTLAKLTDAVIRMIEPQAKDKCIELRNQSKDHQTVILSDFDKCFHILQNIVGNAVKFTDTGCVELNSGSADHQVWIAVSDTGIGIQAESLPHIFEEFRQGDESHSRRHAGTGLGLAIAKRYADLLQGSIAVESTPGIGSKFVITLPLSMELNQSSISIRPFIREEIAGNSELSALKGKNILLVEDSEPAVILIREILMEEESIVAVARNGKQALDEIAASIPDAIILDLMMPEVNGFEVLREIRSAEATAKIPVLILTAKHITREELSFLKGNHIHQLIQKGDISREQLLSAIATMVAKPVSEREPAAPQPMYPSMHRKPIILLVEDNADNRKTVAALLDDEYVVLKTAEVQTALERALLHSPDLILMDISLPGKDGCRLLEEFRAEQKLQNVPVIALTAHAMKGDRERFMAYGFNGYIPKPIDADIFEQTLREFLNGKR